VNRILSAENPLASWLRPTLFLFELDIVQRAYAESYRLLPGDTRRVLEDKKLGYFSDVWRSLDLLLCMHAYRDLQYGPKRVKNAPEIRKHVKLGWIAYNINAAQKLLDQWNQLEGELWKWYEDEDGDNRYRDRKTFKDFIDFLHGYIQTTIAELAVLYVYLYNNKVIMPLGFMQHPVTLGPSGPALGDFIDIETLTFIEVKSQRLSKLNYKYYKSYLLSLAINTRLPSAVAVPRYSVDEQGGLIDDSSIVVEHYTLASAGNKQWIEHNKNRDLEAAIEDYLKPLMQNISILVDNAKKLLRRSNKVKTHQ